MKWLLTTVAVCSVVVGTGCGGGGTPSTEHVTKAHLALMVLPRSALGPAWTRFRDKHPVGFYTNAQSAAGSLDPRITGASLSKDGRLTGYALGYSLRRSRFERALFQGSGALNILTDAELYRDKVGPATTMARGLRDLRALVGKPVRGGAILVRGATFRVPRIGDGAEGIRLEIRIKGFHVHYTEVAFRYGRLLAETIEARADPQNVDTALIAVSRALEGRIERVLTGKIGGSNALGS
jgi:hypothetical protein